MNKKNFEELNDYLRKLLEIFYSKEFDDETIRVQFRFCKGHDTPYLSIWYEEIMEEEKDKVVKLAEDYSLTSKCPLKTTPISKKAKEDESIRRNKQSDSGTGKGAGKLQKTNSK